MFLALLQDLMHAFGMVLKCLDLLHGQVIATRKLLQGNIQTADVGLQVLGGEVPFEVDPIAVAADYDPVTAVKPEVRAQGFRNHDATEPIDSRQEIASVARSNAFHIFSSKCTKLA